MKLQLTSIVWREDEEFVALCPELDVASQGDSRESARAALHEAVEGFLEIAPREEVQRRWKADAQIETFAVERAELAA